MRLVVDPDLVVPNKRLTLSEGAIQPWARAGTSTPWYYSLINSVAAQYGFSTKTPVAMLPEWAMRMLLYGEGASRVRMRHTTHPGQGV